MTTAVTFDIADLQKFSDVIAVADRLSALRAAAQAGAAVWEADQSALMAEIERLVKAARFCNVILDRIEKQIDKAA